MIVGAAVCPAAPFLVDGTADAVAERLGVVGQACRTAIALLPAADVVLLLSSAGNPPAQTAAPIVALPAWRLLPPGTPVPTTVVRRSDLPDPPELTLAADYGGIGNWIGGGDTPIPNPPVTNPLVGTVVGAWLLASGSPPPEPTGPPGPTHPPTTAVEIAGDPAEVAAALAAALHSRLRVAVLVMADGAACHGDHAPGRRDDRSAPFDAALAEALAAGDPVALRLACAPRELAWDLQATVDPLAVLALLTADRPPALAELLYTGAPVGVGYLAASWRWSEP